MKMISSLLCYRVGLALGYRCFDGGVTCDCLWSRCIPMMLFLRNNSVCRYHKSIGLDLMGQSVTSHDLPRLSIALDHVIGTIVVSKTQKSFSRCFSCLKCFVFR